MSTPDGMRALQAKFVVGCDGGTSAVRDMLGSTLVGSTYKQRWLVVDAIVQGHGVKQISFHCDPRRPRVEIPAVGDRVRWEFMRLPDERQEELLEGDTIHSLIADHFGYRSIPDRTEGSLHFSRARRGSLAQRSSVPRGRRRASDAALRGPRHE